MGGYLVLFTLVRCDLQIHEVTFLAKVMWRGIP